MKEPLETVTGAGHRLGEYIRDQRRGSQISLRQLSALAGVSNPYLSQIERGLRKPSAEILQQIAKGLRISAEALYIKAGILEEKPASAVTDAGVQALGGLALEINSCDVELRHPAHSFSLVVADSADESDGPVASDSPAAPLSARNDA